MGIRGEVFSAKTSVGKRTYFFNVKENRHGDLFLNIVESKKNEGSGFERHSVIVFNEDLSNFVEELNKAVDFMQKNQAETPSDNQHKKFKTKKEWDGPRDRDRD